jgi:stage III sporulation protein AF
MVINMEEVYSWIKNIVIYMLLNTIIMNLLGNKSYKKYASIVSGMILVLIVISPLMKLMKLDENLDYYLKYNDFNVNTTEFENSLTVVEDKQREAVFGEYEDKIIDQTKELLLEENLYPESIKIDIDQDTESSTFGKITGINIIAATGGENSNKDDTGLQIEEIEVTRVTIGKRTDSDHEKPPSPLEIAIKNKLSGFYNIEQGNINISIQGG